MQLRPFTTTRIETAIPLRDLYTRIYYQYQQFQPFFIYFKKINKTSIFFSKIIIPFNTANGKVKKLFKSLNKNIQLTIKMANFINRV